MFVEQTRLEDDVVFVGVALLEGDRLVEGNAVLARDVVDLAGQKVGL